MCVLMLSIMKREFDVTYTHSGDYFIILPPMCDKYNRIWGFCSAPRKCACLRLAVRVSLCVCVCIRKAKGGKFVQQHLVRGQSVSFEEEAKAKLNVICTMYGINRVKYSTALTAHRVHTKPNKLHKRQLPFSLSVSEHHTHCV